MDLLSDQRTAAGSDKGADCFPPAGGYEVAEHATADAADDESGRSVVALAIVIVVIAAIDAVGATQPARPIQVGMRGSIRALISKPRNGAACQRR